MTERADLTTDWSESPRLIEVQSPSVNIVMQDLHDTLRSNTLQAGEGHTDNQDDDSIIDSAGKEDLGGGVLVGITSTLQNAQLMFESRTTPAETGTVTTANVAGTTLIDSAATFQTNLVTRGAVVINFTDQSIAEVLSVDSETQLTTRVLIAGANNDYGLTDAYKVWNVIQCEIEGGNLVAVDNNSVVISSVFPTAFTQIVRTSSSSATLKEQADIQFASFNGGVTLDVVNGTSGSLAHPAGTPRQPVTTLADAITIANKNGFDTIFVKGTYVFAASDVVNSFIFQGTSSSKTTLSLTAAASITNCIFRQCTLTGNLDGGNDASFCVIAGLNFFDGTLLDCLFTSAPIVLAGTQANFLRCASAVAGGSLTQTAIIDFNGQATNMILRDYQGGVTIKNCTNANSVVSMDMSSGQAVLDGSNTAGIFTIRGVSKLIDNSAGSTVVDELIEGARLTEVWKLLGLDPNDTITVTPTGVTTGKGSFTIAFTGDGVKTKTMDRA